METSDSGVRWSHSRPSRQLQLLETKSFGDQSAAPGHVALQTFGEGLSFVLGQFC